MAVSRESIGTLTIIMGAMIHPFVVVPIGVFVSTLYRNLKIKVLQWFCPGLCYWNRKIGFLACTTFVAKIRASSYLKLLKDWIFKGVLGKVAFFGQIFLNRFFTLNFNVYLSYVGATMYYLYKSSVSYRKFSEFPLVAKNDYKGVNFDYCHCKSTSDGEDCLTSDENLQNFFSVVPNEVVLLILMIYPIAVHFFHSLIINASPSVPLLDFILGLKTNQMKKVENLSNVDQTEEQESFVTSNGIEMERLDESAPKTHDDESSNVNVEDESYCRRKNICFKTNFDCFCFCLGILYMIGVSLTPQMFPVLLKAQPRVSSNYYTLFYNTSFIFTCILFVIQAHGIVKPKTFNIVHFLSNKMIYCMMDAQMKLESEDQHAQLMQMKKDNSRVMVNAEMTAQEVYA